MRILFVEPLEFSKIQMAYLTALCAGLGELGIEVEVAAPESWIPNAPDLPFPVWAAFHDIYCRRSKWRRACDYVRSLLTVLSLAITRGFDIAHVDWCLLPPVDLLFLILLRLSGKRVVLSAHDVLPFGTKSWHVHVFRVIYRSVSHIVVFSQFARTRLVEDFGLDTNRITVVPLSYGSCGVQTTLTQQAAKRRIGLSPESKVVLFFGLIKREKGLDRLIEAFAQVVPDHPNAVLVIAGRVWHHEFGYYEEIIHRLGIRAKVVQRTEFIPDEEVPGFFTAADLVVLPYTVSYQSAVLRLAGAFAKPVIASSVGAFVQELRHGVTGFLVPPNDTQSLARAISDLLHDQIRSVNVGVALKKALEEGSDYRTSSRECLKAYQSAGR